MKHLVLALSVFLLACGDGSGGAQDAAPDTSPTVDLLSYRTSEGRSSVGVSFAQPDRPECDETDFLLPGEHRVDDDVIRYCPIATCVSEVRLLRGEEVVATHAIESPDLRVSFDFADADAGGLALELRGCGAPRRVPLWESTLPEGAKASLVPGEPGNAIRIATDRPAPDVSLMGTGAGGLGSESDHSLAGAASVRVGMPGFQTYVGVSEIQAHEPLDLEGIEVRRWSGQSLYQGTLCLPIAQDDHWNVSCASGPGTTEIAVGAPGSEVVVPLLAHDAAIDHPDATGLLAWSGDATDPSGAAFTHFELAQGASTDTLGLRRRPTSPLQGPLYQATTPHVAPTARLTFGLEGDHPVFAVTYGALHFVNSEDASDSFDVDGLAFRWATVPIVPRP